MLIGCLVGGLILGIGGSVTTQAFVFTSLLTIPAFSNIPLYALAIGAAFITSMILVIIFDYRTPEQKAAAKLTGDADAPAEAEPRVIVVGDMSETNQARQWVAALGGESNILAVEPVAETRSPGRGQRHRRRGGPATCGPGRRGPGRAGGVASGRRAGGRPVRGGDAPTSGGGQRLTNRLFHEGPGHAGSAGILVVVARVVRVPHGPGMTPVQLLLLVVLT